MLSGAERQMATAAEQAAERQLLLPPAVREGLLREAKQQAAAREPQRLQRDGGSSQLQPLHLLPLAVRAVASADSELRARVCAVQAAAVAKNAAEAADARAAGEQRLQSGDAKGSLAHFTRALRKASQQSPDAAVALGLLYMAHSAALLAVGESRAALSELCCWRRSTPRPGAATPLRTHTRRILFGIWRYGCAVMTTTMKMPWQ